MGRINFTNETTPTTPAAGVTRVYVDSADKHTKQIDDAGAIIDLTTGAGGAGGNTVAVSANDTTPSELINKVVAGLNMVVTELNDAGDEDLSIATSTTVTFTNMTTDNLTVNTSSNFTGTITYNNVNVDGTENYSDYTANYDSTPVLISCTTATALNANLVLAGGAQYAEATVIYDNTGNIAGDTWTKIISITPDSGLVTVNDVANGNSGEISLQWNATLDVLLVNGAGTATVDACYYNGVVTINYNGGGVINNNSTITNNNNTSENNTNVDEYYDAASTVINEGDTVLENLNVTNLTVNGSSNIGDAGYRHWMR